jgi:hypothetical protein
MLKDPNLILIFLSGLVIFSYLVDGFTRKIKFPAVIVLIFAGVGLRYLGQLLGAPELDLSQALPVLGTLGLIIIVFEGALEIRFGGGDNKSMGVAALSGLVILLITTLLFAYMIQYISGYSFYDSLLNAVPLGVVSSTVAISGAKGLPRKSRIFITYESTFSDIFGIILFNFLLNNKAMNGDAFGKLGGEILILIIGSILFSFFILYLLKQVSGHTRFFFIIAVLIFTYGLAKSVHLSALFIVLVLGLFLNNADLIPNKWIRKNLVFDGIRNEMENLYTFSSELAFLMRTFFFIVFGYTIDITNLADPDIVLYGGTMVALAILIRAIVLWLLPKRNINPELFLLPRGLISILLFLAVPENSRIAIMEDGILLFVIIATGLFMAAGLIVYKNRDEG